jgi:hypothetical protein
MKVGHRPVIHRPQNYPRTDVQGIVSGPSAPQAFQPAERRDKVIPPGSERRNNGGWAGSTTGRRPFKYGTGDQRKEWRNCLVTAPSQGQGVNVLGRGSGRNGRGAELSPEPPRGELWTQCPASTAAAGIGQQAPPTSTKGRPRRDGQTTKGVSRPWWGRTERRGRRRRPQTCVVLSVSSCPLLHTLRPHFAFNFVDPCSTWDLFPHSGFFCM